jgi:hypothetical protein
VFSPFRLACLAATLSSLCAPHLAAACLPPEPPIPPPRTSAESESDYAARSEKWYIDLHEAEEEASLPGRVAHEEHLWTTARRIVLARVEKVGSTRLRGSERQYYKSPLVTLRAVKWLRGDPSPRRLKVHFLSDASCDFGGVGDAPEGEIGQAFLLFYRAGPIDPRNILDTFRKDRAVTTRSRAAFARAGASGAEPTLAPAAGRRVREGAR